MNILPIAASSPAIPPLCRYLIVGAGEHGVCPLRYFFQFGWYGIIKERQAVKKLLLWKLFLSA